MDFSLSPETRALCTLARDWANDYRKQWDFRDQSPTSQWASFAALGIFTVEDEGGTFVDKILALVEAAKVGLPGPVFEAELAVAAGSRDARESLAIGRVVSSVIAPYAGPALVGWGAIADLVIDLATGESIPGPLPAADVLPLAPHGWWTASGPAALGDGFSARRWTLAAALLIGLCQGGVDRAAEHARNRVQFGRPIGTRQALQLRLADAQARLFAGTQMVQDAAWRITAGDPVAPQAAALAWLWCETTARSAMKHCHQVFGALGFCDETGLVTLSWQADWIRASVGRVDAERYAVSDRSIDADPECSVLKAYRR